MATTKRTTKSTAAKQADPAPKRVTTPRKTEKIIRNLRKTAVHLRLFSKTPKDPYRIQLSPRGQNGDYTYVPVDLVDDPTLKKATGILVEVITQAEVNALEDEYLPGGYQGRTDAPTIIRPDDSTVMKAPDWDGKGRLPQDRAITQSQRTGTHTIDVPGSDQALHAAIKAGQSAMPAEAVFDRRVSIERFKGD